MNLRFFHGFSNFVGLTIAWILFFKIFPKFWAGGTFPRPSWRRPLIKFIGSGSGFWRNRSHRVPVPDGTKNLVSVHP